MPEFTKLAEMPDSAIPATQGEAKALLEAIKAEAGAMDKKSPKPKEDEIPGLEEPTPPAEVEETIQGWLAVVTEKPTAKGGTKGGLCITQNRDDREGGQWVNTFDTEDIEAAKDAKGSEVYCRVTKDKFGYKLVKRGLTVK